MWETKGVKHGRKRSRPQGRFVDQTMEDVQRVGVTDEDSMEADDQLWQPLKGAAERALTIDCI